MNAKRPRYVVVLTPARGVDDGVKWLRHLLKVAGRSFGLVVITCRMRHAQGRPSGPLGTALDFVAKQERAS